MSWADVAIRFLERHPRLGAVPTPAFLRNALDAHLRRKKLVLEIAALSDHRTAFAALWLARADTVATLGKVPVENGLVVARELVMAGAIGRQ